MSNYITEIDQKGEIAVDDTILIKDVECTAGSRILGGFVPLFDAEAVERIKKAGYGIKGKTNVGEFGLDIIGETSYYGEAQENENLIGAAADEVKNRKVKAALCVDLNGAPRRAAAVSGQTFIKPTYGTVSRYGVIPCACSGEQIGVMSDSSENTKKILTIIAGHDDKDGTSLKNDSYDYESKTELSTMNICLIKELLDAADEKVAARIRSVVNFLEKSGVKTEYISVPEVRYAQAAWQILLAAETCNNISRYDGVKFGYRTPDYKDIDELYIKSRTEGLGILSKETLIYGSDVLSKGRYDVCYDKALRVRRVVMDKMKDVFRQYDAVLIPAGSTFEYKKYSLDKAFENVYKESLFTAVSSITGMPAIVSCGVQLVADHLNESKLFEIASKLDLSEVEK